MKATHVKKLCCQQIGLMLILICHSYYQKEGIAYVVHDSEPKYSNSAGRSLALIMGTPVVVWSGRVVCSSFPMVSDILRRQGNRHTCAGLQSASVHNSVVDGKLTTFIAENKNSDAATALVERIGETLQQTALVNDRKSLLDVTTLGHGNNVTIIADVKYTVLLEHRSVHLLNHHRWRRVGDEGRLLLQLLGEEIDTEVTVLASLRRGGDAYDLAGATLEIQQVTNADVVTGDGDGTARAGAASGATRSRHVGYGLTFFNNFVDRRGVMMVFVMLLVVTRSVDGVQDVVSSAVKSVTERVILAFVVVISHVKLAVLGRVDNSTSLSLDTYFLLGR
jgi:hypothetical protein